MLLQQTAFMTLDSGGFPGRSVHIYVQITVTPASVKFITNV